MALSRSAARTARHRRWLWALTACGGAAGLAVVEGQIRESAREHGQTTAEYAKEHATEAVNSLKKTTSVAGALLRTAMSSALVAMQHRNFDTDNFRADLATTVADLASETPTRRHMVALGGGYFLDWLLQLAYPQLPGYGSCSSSSSSDVRSHASSNVNMAAGSSSSGALHRVANGGGPGLVLQPVKGADSGGLTGVRSSAPSDIATPAAAAEWQADLHAMAGTTGPLHDSPHSSTAARVCREAERALESILRDDVVSGLLLDRPGAVPLLLRAVASGQASSVITDLLGARAADARMALEAMTADLREVIEALRDGDSLAIGDGGSRGLASGKLALQSTAAGLLAALAAGSSANRAKLTGLGLPGVLAEVSTAVSGLSDRTAVRLQWQLLRLIRVMAEHSSEFSDSHHLATCVLPLLYTAADAAAAGDAAMASYAINTLAVALRNGGAPVAEAVATSTMPHLLWQLAEGLGAHRVQAATPSPPLDDVRSAAAISPAFIPDSEGRGAGKQPASSAEAARGAAAMKAKSSRSWFLGRNGPPSSASSSAGGSAGSVAGGRVPSSQPIKNRTSMHVQDSTVVASVANAVAELARSSLLPETQVPRWRDWLLDVLCADGFDPGHSESGSGTGTGAVAESNVRSEAAAPHAQIAAAAFASSGRCQGKGQIASDAAATGSYSSGGAPRVGEHQQLLPSWLILPAEARQWSSAATGAASGGGTLATEAVPKAGQQGCKAGSCEGRKLQTVATFRSNVLSALSALSHMPGNHGLQAAHYWLSRLLSELAARTLPYTSLVYLEGPRAPQDLIHAVPVLPSYVKTVADALERAADAVADDSPALPPHLEFDLAGSGLVGRPTHISGPRRPTGPSGRSSSSSSSTSGNRQVAAGTSGPLPETGGAGADMQHQQQRQQEQRQAQHELDVVAYRQASHVVDVVVAERKAADALEALCAIVAPDLEKQRWLLQRGVLPLLHRLTRTAEDPRVVLQEQGQAGAERVEQEVALGAVDFASAAAEAQAEAAAGIPPASTAATHQSGPSQQRAPGAGQVQGPHPFGRQHHREKSQRKTYPRPHQEPQQQQQEQEQKAQATAVVSDILSDHEGGPSLCLQRQVARMLALLALLPDAQDSLRTDGVVSGAPVPEDRVTALALSRSVSDVGPSRSGGDGWLSWLWQAASSSDCRLSSNATRALLHLAALETTTTASTCTTASEVPVAVAAAGRMWKSVAATRPGPAGTPPGPGPAGAPPPVFLDGVHLLDPGAKHHWTLVQQAASFTATTAAAATLEHDATAREAAMQWRPVTNAADGSTRPEGPGLLTQQPGSSGAGAAVSMPVVAVAVAELEGAPGVYSHDCNTASRRAEAGSGAVVTAMNRGTDGGGDVLPAPRDATFATSSAVSSLVGTIRSMFTLPWSIWGTMALVGLGVVTSDSSEGSEPSAPLVGPGGSAVIASQQKLQGPPPRSSSSPSPSSSPSLLSAGTTTTDKGDENAMKSHLQTSMPSAGVGGKPWARDSGELTEQRDPPSSDASSISFNDRISGQQPMVLASSESPAAGPSASINRGNGLSGGAPNPVTAIPPYPLPYSDAVAPDSTGPMDTPIHPSVSIRPGQDQGTAEAAGAAPPVVDVVFVHGIRGGPFITWRKAGVMTRGSAASHMERSACWPSTWLAEDVPGARLLSVEYLAPVSAWEGESLPLEDNVSRVMSQLSAAGVGTGQRPVVFVAHSMGGLLVKEMLARSMDQAAEGGPHATLAPSTRGIVFFGTPHFGNAMAAMGWKLRHVPGALPAPSLARLTPGPHLLSLNDRLRQLHESQGGALRVVSMLEGQPTQLSGVIPRILIVASDSAYPGFGAAMTMPENDHIDCCKPASRTAPAYLVVRDLVMHAIRMAPPCGG